MIVLSFGEFYAYNYDIPHQHENRNIGPWHAKDVPKHLFTRQWLVSCTMYCIQLITIMTHEMLDKVKSILPIWIIQLSLIINVSASLAVSMVTRCNSVQVHHTHKNNKRIRILNLVRIMTDLTESSKVWWWVKRKQPD